MFIHYWANISRRNSVVLRLQQRKLCFHSCCYCVAVQKDYQTERCPGGSLFQTLLEKCRLGIHLGVLLFLLVVWPCHPSLSLTDGQRLVAEAWKIVDRNYVDRTFHGQNWFQVRQKFLKAVDEYTDAYSVIRNMLSTLEDPYTRFLTPQQYQSLQTTTSGEVSGIGIQLSPTIKDNKVIITYVYPQSPAETAGIRPFDQIRAIDSQPVSDDNTVEEIARQIQGPEKSFVYLELERNHRIFNIRVTRQNLVLQTVTSKFLEKEVGYIRIRNFDFHTAERVQEAWNTFKGKHIRCLILDLRNNSGGYFPAGIQVASLFLPTDEVVIYTVDSHGVEEAITSHQYEPSTSNINMVLLVNEHTASASEIVTAALHDQLNAKVIGSKTFGKGVVQRIFPLSDKSAVSVTVRKYQTPKHVDIHQKGIQPDIETNCQLSERQLICSPPLFDGMLCPKRIN